MTVKEKYNQWTQSPYFDKATRDELITVKDNEKEIEERFYKELEFGTGGLRGIMGAGTNRMNIYTVRKASQGLAEYVVSMGPEMRERGIVIAYDSRNRSKEFAREAALVFAGNGICAYIFDELRPTPELSFALRYLKAAAGIVVTASHNPKEYNGYKAYGKNGSQFSLEDSEAVLSYVNKITNWESIKVISEDLAKEKGLYTVIGSEIDDAYMASIKKQCVNKDVIKKCGDKLKIVYTPLHGAGNKPVRRVLSEVGFKNVMVVPQQEMPDGNFTTVKSPNPEERTAFELAIELASKENADLIIGTDPDSDRLGLVVKDREGEYFVLSGNQTGCLLLEYILQSRKNAGMMPENPFVVSTIVTTRLAENICKEYDVEYVDVLTGFKFIGEQIYILDENGDKNYLFGFEESFGFLAGTDVRDKDAVVSSMVAAEMAAWYFDRGMTLYDGLMEIYKKYGYYEDGIINYVLAGIEGISKIDGAMKYLRDNRIRKFGNIDVKIIGDYLTGKEENFETGAEYGIVLPSSNVLRYTVDDNMWFCVRPSGTEPKIKLYFGVRNENSQKAKEIMEDFKKQVTEVISPLLS